MLLFRWLVFLMLLGALVSFACYAATGNPRFKHYGWVTLKWALLLAFGFFAVLILQRVV
ncbi:hypothetical protein [Rhodoferax sp.]|uniref:hypothetical protein n=1 Tax=Rhodoferax sp. TaxID=50421 RepID=UPI0025FA877A|nr:hypothetical protein [Rhodoferax sp.]MCM2339999.1 hypothetical protein [Rhodoferax sp.]